MSAKRENRGIFITFEGIEGSGKTTLLENVTATLNRLGIDPVITREPGGTQLGIALRGILLDPEMEVISTIAELMLFAADRAQHVSQVLLPALEKGQVILCDRYSDATVAYQGYGRGIPLEAISEVDSQARSSLSPDMTVLLDLPAEEGLGRARNRNVTTGDSSESRIDEEELAFHQKVREGYLTLAGIEPKRFIVLDATSSPQELADLVMGEIRSRFTDVF